MKPTTLIVIDGGKGQLSSALLNIDALGLIKKLQSSALPNDWKKSITQTTPFQCTLTNDLKHLKLFNNCETKPIVLVCAYIEIEEVTYAVSSSLDNIPGIGEKTIIKLLKNFKSVKRIKEAKLAELATSGTAKAKELYPIFTQKRRNWVKSSI